jgi:COP9 signalosome complex subunit 6
MSKAAAVPAPSASSAVAAQSSTTSSGGLDVALHPLVIINISDHYTRMRVQAGAEARVYGALLGTQSGRRIDIENSFEMVVEKEAESGEWRIDSEYLQLKLGQYKRGYETIDIVGWYSTGKPSALGEHDLALQQQMEQYTETPLYLLLDPAPPPNARELPLTLLESQLAGRAEGGVALRFAPVSYHVDSSDAERIAVEHVSRHSTGTQSQLSTQLQSMRGSVATLAQRLALLARYLRAVQKGELAVDAAALRAASALVQLLPAIEGAQFTQNFLLEYSDALLVAYLSAITKTSAALATLLEKFHLAYERAGGGGAGQQPKRRGF